MNHELNFILGKLKPRLKSGNWMRFNCPVCVYNGEPRPDKRISGSLTFDENHESLIYHCFRCNFKSSYNIYKPLSKKFKFLLKNFGFTESDILYLEECYLKRLEQNKNINFHKSKTDKNENLKFYTLPKNTVNIIDNFEKFKNNQKFIEVVKYLINRGEIILEEYHYQFFWNKKTPSLIYMPFFIHNKIVGYVTKNIDTGQYRLYRPKGYFFNQNILYDERLKFIIVVEGPFDALSVGGLGVCGNKISEEHVKLLKEYEKIGKTIIIVPDRNVSASSDFIKKAEENDWYLSLPSFSFTNEKYIWDDNIKDCNEALVKYGKFYTVLSILKNMSKNYFYIKTLLTMNEKNKKNKKAKMQESSFSDIIEATLRNKNVR